MVDMLRPARADADELAALVSAVSCRGDRTAFATLFRALAPRVKGFLLRSGADAGAAEDLTQETLVIVWRKSGTFDARRASVATWVFTIARNLWIDQCRRSLAPAAYQQRTAWLADLPHPTSASDGVVWVLEKQRRDRVRTVLTSLPHEQAETVRMAYFNDATHEQIASRLGIPLGTVKSRIRRAIAALRQRLDGSDL
jgi:RNA polymerase sigma-70 factor (ECF subfamily)